MTVFQKIITGELPAYKVFEDANTMAILDRFPQVPGQVVMFSKALHDSQFSKVAPEVISQLIVAAQQVALLMETRLADVKRVIVVIEGMEVPHLHIKLIPVYSTAPYNHGVTGGQNDYKVQETDLAELYRQLVD
jgi:histidine triad (HIT) family protein